jgi:hypothetical protein
MERWRRTEGYIGYIDGWIERCWALSRVYITERGFPFSRLRFFYFLFCLIFIFLSLTGSSRVVVVGGGMLEEKGQQPQKVDTNIYRKKKMSSGLHFYRMENVARQDILWIGSCKTTTTTTRRGEKKRIIIINEEIYIYTAYPQFLFSALQ